MTRKQTPRYDIAIIGGGCVGLSIAKHLGERSDLDVCLLEKEYHLARHQSGRNSGVLHPGFNYPPGSLKADFAVEGTRRMKGFCAEHDVPVSECGVVVVATTDEEAARLDELDRRARENGVQSELLDSRERIREYEPHAAGQRALYAPEAASVDSQKYVYALATEAEAHGTDLYMGYEVEGIHRGERGFRVETSKGPLDADYLVNAAGLNADRVAHRLGVGTGYRIVPFRGEYYELVPEKRSLVNSMIYPTPDPDLPFLGVHFTRRADDRVIVGPNAVLAFGREAYENTDVDLRDVREYVSFAGFWRSLASTKMLSVAVDELRKSYRKSAFVRASRRLLPDVSEEDFVRSYAGIRAQLVAADGTLVKEPLFEHGPGSTHVLNAVSPGLTCSLPFGEHVATQVLERV